MVVYVCVSSIVVLGSGVLICKKVNCFYRNTKTYTLHKNYKNAKEGLIWKEIINNKKELIILE